MPLPRTHVTDAYGKNAKALLQPLQPELTSLASEVTEKFYAFISDQGRTAEIIRRLRPNEFKRLKRRQTRYLVMLMSDDLTHRAHLREARKAGRAHTFVDVEILWLVEAYSFYEHEIYQLLKQRILDSKKREASIRVIAQRFLQDIEGQASSYKKITAEIASAFSQIDQSVMSMGNMTDLVRDALSVIGSLPGDVSVSFSRADELGVMQIEQSYGAAAEKYQRAMESGEAPKICVDPSTATGKGPGGQAWRSGNITVSNAWLVEPDKAPWQKAGGALGFRSSAAIPLLDDSGHSIALLSLYSAWPGFFSTESVNGFLIHVQQVLSHAIQLRMSAPVVPLREQQAYRTMLDERRLVMYYQPVINLRDGSLIKVEALARMRDAKGRIIAPHRFLPALGRHELLMLFEYGMEQIGHDVVKLRSQGIDTKTAINFPPEGFDDARYEQSLFKVLETFDLTADRIQLEVLETRDTGAKDQQRKSFVQRLQAAGIQIAQDDLGSGHSSLLRLDQYPFDEVKIDQGLVRGALHNPKRAVEFILYLTRLAHAFNTPVTVEGLENLGLIEAAAILGADYGQGYGIAKPMPVDLLAPWHRSYKYPVNPRRPQTALGAMAGFLLWEMQLAAFSEKPELVTKFVGAKSIVEQFLKANNLRGGPIDQLLRHNHRLVASGNTDKESASKVRMQLIEKLTAHWLDETSP